MKQCVLIKQSVATAVLLVILPYAVRAVVAPAYIANDSQKTCALFEEYIPMKPDAQGRIPTGGALVPIPSGWRVIGSIGDSPQTCPPGYEDIGTYTPMNVLFILSRIMIIAVLALIGASILLFIRKKFKNL